MIKIENEKVIFTKDDCPFNPGEKILIQYEQKNGLIYPVIGLDYKFQQEGGYKLTKSYYFSIKGKNYAYISAIGTEFVLEEIKDGIYRMNPIAEGVIIEEEKIDYDLEIIDDDNYEIELIKTVL